MAGGIIQPLTIKRQAPTAPLEVRGRNVDVGDGLPWAVHIDASCYLAAATLNVGPTPKLGISIYITGERSDVHVRTMGEIDFDLLIPGWEGILNDAASTCVNDLTKRQVPVPDEFRERLLVALREARITAILLVVRYQAASLIHHIPSSEACRIWSEVEAGHIMEEA